MKFHLLAVPAVIATLFALPAAAADWAAVGAALGKTGSVEAGDVYRVGLPRTDLKVTLDGVALKPTLALGSWLAFHEMGGSRESNRARADDRHRKIRRAHGSPSF